MKLTNRLFVLLLLTFPLWIMVGCVSPSPDGAGSPPIGEAPVGSPPTEPAQVISGVEVNRSESIAQDVGNAVEQVKSQNSFLPRHGVFGTVGIKELDIAQDQANGRTGGDNDITNLSVGYDRVVRDGWLVGTLLDVARDTLDPASEAESDLSSSGSTLSLFLFSSWAFNEFWDLSGYASYGQARQSIERSNSARTVQVINQNGDVSTINLQSGEVLGESRSDVASVGLSVARRFTISSNKQLDISLDADRYSIQTDEFTEQGETDSELRFSAIEDVKTLWTLSAGISRFYNTKAGVLVPTLTLAVVSEDRDNDAVVSELVVNPGQELELEAAQFDNSYGFSKLDLVWVRPRGFQFFANLRSSFANDFEQFTGGSVGARLEF